VIGAISSLKTKREAKKEATGCRGGSAREVFKKVVERNTSQGDQRKWRRWSRMFQE
jgi:hypothetical protein